MIKFATIALMLMSSVASARGPEERPAPLDAPGPIIGAIEITNERDRPTQIFVDGRFAIELRARSTQTLESVPNGVRLVSYPGAGREGRWQTDRVDVREGRRAALRISPLRGQVAIVNRAEVDMKVMLGELDLGVVKPGRELVSHPVFEGPHRLLATPVGWQRVKPQAQDVTIVAGDIAKAEIHSVAATLIVSNPFPRRVTVWIDGERVARLERMESERLTLLQPGRTFVELRDDGRVLAAESIELQSGRESYFAPALQRHGALEVKNPTRRPVRVTIEVATSSRKSGREPEAFRHEFILVPGDTRLVDDLALGPITIAVRSDDGRSIRHQAQIVAGETNRFVVPRR